MEDHSGGTPAEYLGTAQVGRAQVNREGAEREGDSEAGGREHADGADAQLAENSSRWRHGGYSTAESLDVRSWIHRYVNSARVLKPLKLRF